MKRIAPNIYVATEYHGVNVGFIVVPGGAIAVDAPTLPRDARAWRQQIVKVTGGPIRYVALTDAHPDRLLSASLLGAPLIAAWAAYEQTSAYTEGFWRSIIEGWARRYQTVPEDITGVLTIRPEIMFTDHLTLHKGEMQVTIRCIAGATAGSAWIYLPEQDVLFAGDTVVETHPFLATAPDTKAWLDTLRSLRRGRFSKTVIVPGRGPLCDWTAAQPLGEYIALARRRVRSLQTAGGARVDKTTLVAELLPLFPVSDDERESVQRSIKAGLDHLVEELRKEGASDDDG